MDPFSPFVANKRLNKSVVKRRQSQLPPELIDWDGPIIPEVEKDRIIYEDFIKQLKDQHEVEKLVEERISSVVHDCIVDEYRAKLKQAEEQISKGGARVNLLLGQIKMFESSLCKCDEEKENLLNANKALDEEKENLVKANEALAKEKENLLNANQALDEDRNRLMAEIETLNFTNNETTCELNHNLELYVEKKNEFEVLKKKFEAVKSQLSHYKKIAKGL